MNKSTFISFIVIIIAILGFLTAYKLKDYPNDNACCKDIRNDASKVCKDCTKYNYFEKIIYVWKYS